MRPARFAVGAILATAVAVASTVWMQPWTPFDERFESCEADGAEWKLVVRCGVQGTSDSDEHVDYFRPRPPTSKSEWRLPFQGATVQPSGWLTRAGSERYVTSLAIGCDFGEGGSSGSETRWTLTDTASGVDIAIGVERTDNGTSSPIQTARFSVPFRRAVSGRQGSLEYRASWLRVK